MRRFFHFLSLFSVLILAACGGTSTIQKVESSSSPEQSQPASAAAVSQQPEEEEKGPEIFAMGDTVQYDELLITLNGVRTSEGDTFLTPDNDFFLILDLTIENTGTEPEVVSSLMQMSLFDADSYSYNPTFFTDTKGSVDGEVAPGRKMRGEIVFDVPAI